MLERRGDESGEKRVWVIRLRLELRVELRADVKRMLWQFDNFHQALFGGYR
jgi:hypothetical protein